MNILSATVAVAEGSTEVKRFDLDSLRKGDILFQTTHKDQPGGGARVTALFKASPMTIWGVMGQCKYEFMYVRGLKYCNVVESQGDRIRVHHRLRNSWYTPLLDFTFDASVDAENTGSVLLVEGNLKTFEATWRMVPLPDENDSLALWLSHKSAARSAL